MNETPETTSIRERVFTRRNYLVYRSVMQGTHTLAAMEAVSSTALAHPEWDMDEEMTWAEWEAHERGAATGGQARRPSV
jgi:hypothetical protein